MPYAGPDDPGAQGEQPSTKSRCRWRSTRSTQDSAGARVDQCARCKDQRHGWCDQYSTFYCEYCWTQFDTVQGAGGRDYVGKIWHDEILKEDNIAAEDEDDGDGGNLLEYVKKTASLIENDKKHASSCQDAGNDSDGENFEEDDEVKDLPNDNALSKFAKPSGFELQPAHVVVIVDTSGSMRTEDVKPENGLDCITRIAAVTCSLATFFQKHVQSSSPHKFLGDNRYCLFYLAIFCYSIWLSFDPHASAKYWMIPIPSINQNILLRCLWVMVLLFPTHPSCPAPGFPWFPSTKGAGCISLRRKPRRRCTFSVVPRGVNLPPPMVLILLKVSQLRKIFLEEPVKHRTSWFSVMAAQQMANKWFNLHSRCCMSGQLFAYMP